MLSLPPLCERPANGTELPSAEGLVEAARRMIQAGEPAGVHRALASMGAPTEDLLCNPYSAQIALMGYADGRAYYHHELRGYFPVPEALCPETAVWDANSSAPIWRNGLLESPKYFSFGVETVMVPYHPNFRRKWRVHELLHTQSGFFWSPELNRFSIYLGSRLSELLPIVHWYGLDEIFRPRCPRHKGKLLYREFCPGCESGYELYWNLEPQNQDLDDAHRHARHALEHYATELTACKEEARTGRRVPTPRPNLDASSDSVGYLQGHWNRLTAWSFGAFIEHFMVPGLDYCPTIDALVERVERTFQDILAGGLVADAQQAAQNRLRRRLQDVGYRSFLALEWTQEQQIEEVVLPAIENCAALSHRILEEAVDPSQVEQAVDELVAAFAMFSDAFPDSVVSAIPEFGYARQRDRASVSGVLLGLESSLPESIAIADRDFPEWRDRLNQFITSPEFMDLGTLPKRFACWAAANLPSQVASNFNLESWLRHKSQKDDEAEHFAVLPSEGEWDEGRLRLNASLRFATFGGMAIDNILGWEIDGEELELASVLIRGEPRIIPCHTEVSEVFSHIRDGTLPPKDELVMELLDSGFLVWLPRVN